jgi:uncharacterized damage-inducible protein DinB
LDRLKTYNYLTLARRRIFDWTRPLSPESYRRSFPIGLGSLARTLTHVMSSEWYYVERMLANDVAPHEHWPIRDEDPPEFAVLESAWSEQAARTVAAIGSIRDWTTELEYRVTLDGVPTIIGASPSDIFTQLVLHEVHHRAQAMNMLRQLGIPAEDIDYNTMTYRRRPALA